MNEKALLELRNKVNKADKLNNTMFRIDNIIKEMGRTGKCRNIEFEYYGEYSGREVSFGLEQGDYTNLVQNINAKELGLTEEEYKEYFSVPLISYLKELRDNLAKKFEELE